ncbi:hypothetical protein [Pseudoxanthomonas mexicana]|uniref:hypothetical protein n=1 Tax=Pseudoxanthomonas mexicana TaxID=128785 RepID=UPI0028A1F5CD|nr:hypothetical protein [Pseudoxanthomonas mexicana]
MKARPQPVKHSMVQRFRNHWLERFGDVRLSQFIDSVFPLSQASDAQRRRETNCSVGKIILTT